MKMLSGVNCHTTTKDGCSLRRKSGCYHSSVIRTSEIALLMKVSALDKPKCASQILDRTNPQVLKLSKACLYGWGVRGRPPLTLVMHRKYLLLYCGVAPVCIIRIWQSWVHYTVCLKLRSIRICGIPRMKAGIKHATTFADTGGGVRQEGHTMAPRGLLWVTDS